MKPTLKISLKPNEKIYLNGAVVRADRKVTIELLNDVQFLLESHVIQAAEASTPLRQLYFMVQIMLMEPEGAAQAREMFRKSLPLLIAGFENPQISSALKQVDALVAEGSVFEALKTIRSLYGLEAKAMGHANDAAAMARPVAMGARA
ncbi:flagellar biosynthesis repressor FlbT [Mesorhizobium sp. CN2-181]|uniref:flagellar biosynthesis repressor FlbT n=1 Tax=Mesorhizobium yinganensis TaxID=3157707 RepID=UPI0032B7D8DC